MMMDVERITLIAKTSMLKSSLCNYSNAYILVSGTITVAELEATEESNNLQVVFKKSARFADCISEINNAQTDNAKDIDAVLPKYHLMEYNNNYSKTSGSLW